MLMIPTRRMRALPQRMQGVTLLETLIAFFVLSGGMLALAFMQAQAIKLNTDSYVRTQASLLAYDLIDRMKLNPDEASNYEKTESEFANLSSCVTNNFTADNDLACWKAMLSNKLPEGRATIDEDDANAGTFTITLFWTERLTRDPDKTDNIVGEERSQSWVFQL